MRVHERISVSVHLEIASVVLWPNARVAGDPYENDFNAEAEVVERV